MITQEFTKILEENPALQLKFQIEDDKFIEPTYHITEIKNSTIDSVDCGGNKDAFNHTIVQLWVNPNEPLRRPWTAQKAYSIFGKVDRVSPIDPYAEIFFEYGDLDIRTAHFSPEDISITEDSIIVDLFVKGTACKPRVKAGTDASCC